MQGTGDKRDHTAGQAKRDAVVKILDDICKLPFWLEPLDGWFIGLVLDQMVGLLNSLFGNNWIENVLSSNEG